MIQIKLTGQDWPSDVATIEDVLGALSDNQLLLADFNGGLGPDDAICRCPGRLSDPRLMLEELCSGYDDNRAVAEKTGARVIFDQCLKSPTDSRAPSRRARLQPLPSRSGLLGGLSVARAARDLCTSGGMAMRIDGPWCGPVAAAATLQLALGAPDALLVASCDLSAPLVIDERLDAIQRDPVTTRITIPPDAPGHGVVLPPDISDGFNAL